MNKCIFLGRLTSDPELKYAPSGTPIANFTLAVNRKFQKEDQPSADFLPHVVIGKLAEVINKYCQKGSQVAVSSRVQTRNWEDKDGKKHYVTEFVVEDFSFAGSKNTNSNNKPTSSDDEEFVL